MIKLSKKTEYGLMALKHLSSMEPNEKVSARELCQKYQIPFDTVSKVLQILCNAGVVKSTQGARGGYSLILPLDKMTIGYFIQLLEENTPLIDCLAPGKTCSKVTTCNIISPMQLLMGKVEGYLQHLTLAELFKANPINYEQEETHP